MDTFSYSENNVKTIIGVANELNVEMLAMVDTYSLATERDVDRVYSLYRENLNKNIKVGFHSHNNQLNSYALARHFVEICEEDRVVTLDCSLYGMGRGGGNLNTEIITEHSNRYWGGHYEMKPILDLIDNYICKFKSEYRWGYSLDMLYAGLYGVHVYTTSYLLGKPNVSSYDLKCMFEMLDEHKKKRYDYDYLDTIYEKYMSQKEGK
jgi:4-hydroxy 2-oxovalerate aldolase